MSDKVTLSVRESAIEEVIAKSCGSYKTGGSYTFEDVWNCIEAALSDPVLAASAGQADDSEEMRDAAMRTVQAMGLVFNKGASRWKPQFPAAKQTEAALDATDARRYRALKSRLKMHGVLEGVTVETWFDSESFDLDAMVDAEIYRALLAALNGGNHE